MAPASALASPFVAAPAPRNALHAIAGRLGLDLADCQHHEFLMEGHAILSTVVFVTADMARMWLQNFNDPAAALASVPVTVIPAGDAQRQPNRRLSDHVADGYARTMADGRWRVSPQNVIAFDENGFILDGQHRLAAISDLAPEDQADTTAGVWFRVEIGWPRSSFANVDCGFRRSGYQLINAPYAIPIAGAARLLGVLTGMAMPHQIKSGEPLRVDISNEVLLEWVAAWPEVVEHALLSHRVYSATKISTTTHLAVLALAARSDYAARIESWTEGLIVGSGLSADDPRLHLRNRWARDGKALRTDRKAQLVLLIKAWNAFAQSKGMGVLRANSTEDIPRMVGLDHGRTRI